DRGTAAVTEDRRQQLAADIAAHDAKWNEETGDWEPLAREYLRSLAGCLDYLGYRKAQTTDGHPFKPSGGSPFFCATCGAARTAAWHAALVRPVPGDTE